VKVSGGTVIYIDQNNKHIYELSNRIRFINVQDFSIENSEMFLGFILGLISSDHDLDKIFLDNFKILSKSHSDTLETILDKLYELSEKYEIDFIVSLSMPADELPEKFKKLVVKAL
jgi:hypothetical protein